jgi:hypothetical protein
VALRQFRRGQGGDKAAGPHPRSGLTQLPLCSTRPGAFVRYKTHCDRKAHNLFLFICWIPGQGILHSRPCADDMCEDKYEESDPLPRDDEAPCEHRAHPLFPRWPHRKASPPRDFLVVSPVPFREFEFSFLRRVNLFCSLVEPEGCKSELHARHRGAIISRDTADAFGVFSG